MPDMSLYHPTILTDICLGCGYVHARREQRPTSRVRHANVPLVFWIMRNYILAERYHGEVPYNDPLPSPASWHRSDYPRRPAEVL